MNKPRLMKIADVKLTDALQTREALDVKTIAEYAELYGENVNALPPVDVFEVKGKGTLLVDGWHRYAASKKAGKTKINVNVLGAGALKEAMVFAIQANSAHGLRRTHQDKRRAVSMALDHNIKGARKMSYRELGEMCGVGHAFAGRVMTKFEKRAQKPKAKPTAFDEATNGEAAKPQLELPEEPKTNPPPPKRDPHELILLEYRGTRDVYRRLRYVFENYANLMLDSDPIVIKLAECVAEIEQRMHTLENKMKGGRL